MTTYPLKSCPKKYTYYQDKAENPEITIINAIKALKKAGIKFELNNITGYYPLKIPAYTCVQTNKIIKGFVGDSRSWGKGATENQAKASALMELIERRTGNLYFINKNNAIKKSKTLFKCYNDIKEDKVPLNTLIYNTTAKENKDELYEFISKKRMTYTEFYSLTEEKWKFLPLGWHLYFNGSNGLAAGNTIEEAVLQGLYEVIERHNTAVCLSKPVRLLNVKTSNIFLRDLLDKFPKDGVEITLFNITTDIKVPTVYCSFLDKNERGQLKYAQGWGTTGSLEKSAIRALTEAALVIHQKRYSIANNINPIISDIMLNPIIGTNKIWDISNIEEDDILDEIKKCVSILKKKGCEVLFKNITSKELKIPVVYVVCTNTIKNETMTTPLRKKIKDCLVEFYNFNYLFI